MSQLFLKARIKKNAVFCIIFITCHSLFANDTVSEPAFIWQCANANAYLLYSYTDVAYTKSWSNYKRQVSFQSKMVINNKSGVDEFAFLNLSKFVINHLNKIKVKTIKSDGSIVELDSSIILNRKNKDAQQDLIAYPIPGVEPGDTIETTYTYTEYLNLYELRDFVSLFNATPSLKTEFTIKLPPNLSIRYKSYNGFPEPQVLVNDTIIYGAFKMEKIKGLEENKYACLPCELPYFYYSVNTNTDDLITWKDVYNNEFNLMTQPLLLDSDKSSYYRRWKRKIIDEATDSSKYYKFNLLCNDILENFSIEPAKEDEFLKSSGYFLSKQRLDPISTRRLYRQLLEDLEIKYWAVFARSKRAGKLDPNYIRKGEFDHIFFAYENSTGGLSLLYPHDINYMYQINEIPTSLYNTVAVIVQPYYKGKIKLKDKYINIDLEIAEVDSVNIDLIALRGISAKNNNLKQVIYCNVDSEKQITTFGSQFSVSGGLSTDLRSFFSVLNKNQEVSDFYDALYEFEGDNSALDIDTITNTHLTNKPPFTYKINAKGTIKNTITFLSDSLVNITLDKLIQHSEISSEKDSIDLNYYLDYCYGDFCMYILSFPCDIEVLNLDNYNKELKNNLGEYTFQVKQMANNQLVIQSNYKIINDLIVKNEYILLKDLNDLVKEIKNLRLIVKLL